MEQHIIYAIITIILTGIFGIIRSYIIRIIKELDKVKELAIDNKSKIDLVENNHGHLNTRFDLLYNAVKDLTIEIRNLSKELSKKKDI